jgi:4-amino-4-deoxy-L-arabinose transferase-like glycosyltransferase
MVRVCLIFYFGTWHFANDANHWNFGYENGQVARSLTDGAGFASPFPGAVGPTAWLAPAYPWLLSLVFRVFGTFSPSAALAALMLNALLSAATCTVIYWFGREFCDEVTGLLAAILFALNPTSIWHTITSIWDVTASTLLLAVLIYTLAKLRHTAGLKPAIITGVVAGVLALFNPACLIVYLAGAAWICLRERRLLPALAGVPLVLCLPWMLRNEAVLHRLTLKSNFGTELRIGNNPRAPATAAAAVMDLHPSFTELAIYRRLGETAYVDWCGQQAEQFIREHPVAFVKLVARRVLIFWTGSEDSPWAGTLEARWNWQMLKRIVSCSWGVTALMGLLAGRYYADHTLLFLSMAAYPLPYYLTHVTNRYRMPLEPVMAVLAAHALLWCWRRLRHTRFHLR